MTGEILVPINGVPKSEETREKAVELAEKTDRSIHAVYIIGETMFHDADFWDRLVAEFKQEGRETLELISARAETAEVDITTGIEQGNPVDIVRSHVKELEPELVMMPRYCAGKYRDLLIGSFAKRVVQVVDVPVITFSEEASWDEE